MNSEMFNPEIRHSGKVGRADVSKPMHAKVASVMSDSF